MPRIPAPATIRRMLVALIAMVAVPLAALGTYGVFRGYQTRHTEEMEASAEIARAVAAAFEAFIVDLVQVEHAFGVASADHTYEQIERDLWVVAAEYPAVRDMSWIAPDGKVLASTEHGLTGRSLWAREYFQDIARGAEWRVSRLVPSLVDDVPLFIVARAIRGPARELRAVVAAAIDADRLGAVLGRRSRGGWTAVVDRTGTLVAITPDRHLTWDDRRSTSEHPWVARALSGEEVRGTYRSVLEGRDRIGAIVPIPSIGWAAHASRPLADTVAAARREAVRNGLGGLVVALAAIAAAFLVARRIAVPLRALEQHAAALAQGGGELARIRGPAEIRQVARALDAMASALSARRAELEAAHRGAQAAAERAEARGAELDAVVAALPVGLVVTDGEGRLVRVNGVAREILAFGEGDVLGTVEERARPFRVYGADGRLLGLEDYAATRALRGQRVLGELLRLEREGSERTTWLAVSAAPIFGPDQMARGSVTTIVDVTHVRALQEERETLIHTVSHDLRTPLSVIVNHAELLRRRGGEEARRRGDAILSAAGRMERLVQDLVDAARLETGRVQLRSEPIDLARFLTSWRQRMAGVLPLDRVRISVPEQVPVIVADPARLDQIVANLVSNALKYSVAGSAVEVELAAESDALRLSIRDHGEGIAPDDLPRVFERYWRARGTSGAEGLGLGLFITRKLVEAHGWRIVAESELGRGSVFTVVVPLDGAQAAPARGAA